MRGERYVAMEQAGDGAAGAGGGGGAPSGDAAAAAAAAAAAGGGDPGAAASLLATGKDQTPDPTTWLSAHPQFAVNGADGKPDVAQSAAKLAGSYGELAKRMKDVGSPPKEAKDYTITVPRELEGKFDPKGDKLIEGFLANAHAAGMTQKQVDLVMGQYFGMAKQMSGAAASVAKEEGEAKLRESWKTDGEFKAGLQNAFKALETFGGDTKTALLERYGNDPDFVRLMASVGKELQEDVAPTVDGIAGTAYAAMTHDQLMACEAYKNTQHPDHERVSKLVRAQFEKKYGTESV